MYDVVAFGIERAESRVAELAKPTHCVVSKAQAELVDGVVQIKKLLPARLVAKHVELHMRSSRREPRGAYPKAPELFS